MSPPLREKLGGHLPVLDGVRGIAILVVVLYHSNMIHRPATAAEHGWLGVVNAGWAGVDLFFVLSGFLITGILFDAKGKDGFFRRFWVRRVLRIFPLYYAFLILSFYVLPPVAEALEDPMLAQGLEETPRAWFWAYLPNFLFALEGEFVGPRHLHATWSLGIEEQFYVLWPLVVFFLSRRALLRLCLAAAAASVVVRFGLYAAEAEWITAFVLPFARLDCILLGAFAALYLRSDEELDLARLARLGRFALAGGLLGVVVYSVNFGYLAQYHPAVHTVGFTVLALMFVGLLGAALVSPEESRLVRVVGSSPLRFLGRYSYGLYLLHPIVQHLVMTYLLDVTGLYHQLGESRVAVQLVFTVVSTLLSVGVAFVVYHAFERHFLALKKLFPMPTSREEEARARR